MGQCHWQFCGWASMALLIMCYCRKCYWCCFVNVPLVVQYHMQIQHNRAPVHLGAQTQQNLNTQFLDRWLGCGSPISWSEKLLELNTLDSLLWGHLKEILDLLTGMKYLITKCHAAVTITDADMLQCAQASLPWCAVACQQIHSGH